MKNKKSIYILIPLVAIIWGIILWQVFSYQPSKSVGDLVVSIKDNTTIEDTSRYELTANYQDPFLRSRRITQNPVQKRKSNNIKPVRLNSVTVLSKPTGLVYRGVISGSNNKIGLLEIGEEKMLISEKSTVSDYEIMQVGEDSLIIRHHDILFTYAKQ